MRTSVEINTPTLLSAYFSTTLDKLRHAAKKTDTDVSLVDGDFFARFYMSCLSPECVTEIERKPKFSSMFSYGATVNARRA